MDQITKFLILFIFLTSISTANELIVFEFTEEELSELEVRKIRGADNKTKYTVGSNDNGNNDGHKDLVNNIKDWKSAF